ncbi:hemerythrin domain-containing protein [Evansella tamaricis]|uniref:Hemerythrin domain-containing protein n=1 Tax=Evansella tamaricis TaxID=2069301 RepID=A0ABS6JCU1_9BACI|nr:hemerythrin domain-containing protein [Evansella tamaricis]MBU9711482.1 hemerythrin domain-containing protein [Evansella tamaricis]
MTDYLGCLTSGFQKPDVYCKALQLLIEEHAPLVKEMNEFYYTASLLAYDPSREDKLELLQKLYKQIELFSFRLEHHSKKEEKYLFKNISSYIGGEGGPVLVMEEEHLVVKDNLTQFLRKFPTICCENKDDIRDLTHHISIVFHTLTDHFLKEEEILFPLAESLLTNEEKESLLLTYEEMKAG